MKSENDHLLKFVYNYDGTPEISKRSGTAMLENRYYNFDTAEGIEYIVDVSKPVGERILITGTAPGEKFDLEKKYNVALNSYRGNGGGGHLVKGAKINKDELSKRVVNSTEKDLRFYMMKWIKDQEIVTPKEIPNWHVVPKDWFIKAKEKDYKLMFDNGN